MLVKLCILLVSSLKSFFLIITFCFYTFRTFRKWRDPREGGEALRWLGEHEGKDMNWTSIKISTPKDKGPCQCLTDLCWFDSRISILLHWGMGLSIIQQFGTSWQSTQFFMCNSSVDVMHGNGQLELFAWAAEGCHLWERNNASAIVFEGDRRLLCQSRRAIVFMWRVCYRMCGVLLTSKVGKSIVRVCLSAVYC